MGSRNVGAKALLASTDFVHKPLNYDKYRDLENEFAPHDLIAFVQSMGQRYKD